MRDFSKALENIRRAIQDQDSEFRREEGLEPRKPKPAPKMPSLKPEPAPQTSHEDSGGKFAADRFLNTSIGQESAHTHPAPEIVEVIPQKDSRHSWLYNEVAKAVQNASDGSPNTKVVAVFVPVVQSGHELENLPVHETVELPPVHEEDLRIEDEIDIQDDPVTSEQEPQEPETQEPEDADMTPQAPQEEQQEPEIFADEPQEQEEQVQEEQVQEEPQVQEVLDQEDSAFSEPEQNTEQHEPEELDSPALESLEPEQELEQAEPESPEALSEKPEQAEHLDELLPESIEHPDPELAEAYNTMEEKFDESIAEDLPALEFHDELEDDEIIDTIDESSEDTNAI